MVREEFAAWSWSISVRELHLAPSPISTGRVRAATTIPAAARRLTVTWRITPVERSAINTVYRRVAIASRNRLFFVRQGDGREKNPRPKLGNCITAATAAQSTKRVGEHKAKTIRVT